jgi:hypothetical protein
MIEPTWSDIVKREIDSTVGWLNAVSDSGIWHIRPQTMLKMEEDRDGDEIDNWYERAAQAEASQLWRPSASGFRKEI